MYTKDESLETLQDIRRIMEQSSRFISLSGWSGIAAGICAMAGAWQAQMRINEYISGPGHAEQKEFLLQQLWIIAIATFAAAGLFAFIFTFFKSRKNGIPIWGLTARRLVLNTIIPMAAGGIVTLRMLQSGNYEMIAPFCLIFYGLALVNACKYTFTEIRYLGYAELILGLANLWLNGSSLYFWAAGFGVLHIVYGIWMWWKYERVKG
jgi:hypothetical protein